MPGSCTESSLKTNISKVVVKLKAENTVEKHRYETHLQRVREMKHVIDVTDPKLLISLYLRPTQVALDYERLKTLTLENLELLERINRIERTQGRTDNYKRNACIRHTQLSNMIKRNKQIQGENQLIAKKILCVKNEVKSCKQLYKEWKFVLKLIEHFSNYPLILPELRQINELDMIDSNRNRPMVYLDLGVKNGRPLGRLIILLYVDLVPRTVKNFIDLCENHRQKSLPTTDSLTDTLLDDNLYGVKKNVLNENNHTERHPSHTYDQSFNYSSPQHSLRQSNPQYSYHHHHRHSIQDTELKRIHNLSLYGTVFHRIFPNLYMEGGNLKLHHKNKNFKGVEDFPQESFKILHNCKGTLAMTPNCDNMVNSEFSISLKPLKVLNGKRVAFGKIIKGLNILDVIESYGTKNGKSKKEIQITNCGILKLNLPHSI